MINELKLVREWTAEHLLEVLRDEVPWVNPSSPRQECFMASADAPQTYSYGNDNEARTEQHTYKAVPMHPRVFTLMKQLNDRSPLDLSSSHTKYNVCVLNYYLDQHQFLGWHADDSPEQDLAHPIAVISFGATRAIWVKRKLDKGAIPESQKFLLEDRTLFEMPGGFQDEHFHRIPKHDRPCGPRISLTFRRLIR